MKKTLAAALVFALVLSQAACALAEGGVMIARAPSSLSDAWDSFTDWAGQAWDDTSDWAGQAWDDTAQWAGQAWDDTAQWAGQAWDSTAQWAGQAWDSTAQWAGQAWQDASKWLDTAWSDTSGWFVDIWGDTKDFAIDAYQKSSVVLKAAWDATFHKGEAGVQDSWAWLKERASAQGDQWLDSIRSAVPARGQASQDDAQAALFGMLGALGIDEAGAGKVRDSIVAYAGEKGLDAARMLRLSLPYTYQLVRTCQEQDPDQSIPAVVVTQFLLARLESLGLEDDSALSTLVDQLGDTLSDL